MSIFARSVLVDLNRVTCLINLRVAFHAINARRLPLASLVYTLVRPPMTTSVVNNLVFRGFFEKQKLSGPNFIDWYRQLRIVLSVMGKFDYLEQPIPPALAQLQTWSTKLLREVLLTQFCMVKGQKEIAESVMT
ncbi:hypothetical protein Tco_0753679 [Tanacetum coccineum]